MQNVFIVNIKSLYEILNEIKENLSFKVIKFENEDYFQKSNDLDTLNCLIITKTNHKLLLNNNIPDKNFFDLNDLPLPLKKLLENINVKLIKLKFNNQSKIIIKGYELNLNSRMISKNKKILKLTEKEILVILFLFNANNPKNINDLQKKVWKQKLTLETHTVETHIYRLRQKFLKVFNDKFFISSEKLGYSI
jgi:hypothetical protein